MILDVLKKYFPHALLISIIIALCTYVFAETKKEIESKASYETVTKMLEDNRIKDERAYKDRCEQIKINQKLLESVQMLMIKQEIRDKEESKGKSDG